jgi:2,3-bisphosphoglycerate-dependent phosphoglycerate mutase
MGIRGNLQRRPFLAPIGLFALTAMAGALILLVLAWLLITSESTTVIVLRHAETVLDTGSGLDPSLSARGQARAESLARMFGDTRLKYHIDAIYTSSALRDRSTAAPLAEKLGITPEVVVQDDPHALVRRVLHEHPGGRILVVGHVDTVAPLVAAFSGVKGIPPVADPDYGTIYIVTVRRIGRANILTVSY